MKDRFGTNTISVKQYIEYMRNVLPDGLAQHLATLSNRAEGKQERKVSRLTILHYIGNLAVITAAGLDHAISEDLRGDYEKILRAFMEYREGLKKHSIDILPQIDEAYQLVRNPELDY